MTLTPHQDSIISEVIKDIQDAKSTDFLADKLVELTGGAGVGKTFSILYIINYFRFMGWNIAITTPTHASLEVAKQIAKKFDNKNSKGETETLEAMTIHSFLSLRIENDFKTGTTKLVKEHSRQPKKCDLLIIDEKSMVPYSLHNYVLEAIEKGNVKSVLYAGDPFQLDPITN